MEPMKKIEVEIQGRLDDASQKRGGEGGQTLTARIDPNEGSQSLGCAAMVHPDLSIMNDSILNSHSTSVDLNLHKKGGFHLHIGLELDGELFIHSRSMGQLDRNQQSPRDHSTQSRMGLSERLFGMMGGRKLNRLR